MRLSREVWFLWGWRILAVNILLYPVADYFKDTFKAALPLLLSADLVLITSLIIKYKILRITLDGNRLTILQGLFLRRAVCIRLNRTCATKKLSTPLCQKLCLCNLIIYCEGVRFILPPIKKSLVSHIEKVCKSR